MKKKKILMISDHALSTSGVGTQSRHIINGLVSKGEWTVRQLGAAIKHQDYNTIKVNDDFIIKPIDGFGNKDMLRLVLAQEKPDVLFIFTDPRFFIWLFEMEDEIHQICPIVWWHVWDNYPYPEFNTPLYQATDLINCHSHMTYTMIKDRFPEKTNFVPHSLPRNVYARLPREHVESVKLQLLGQERKDHFVAFWMNRNAKRKRPNDVLLSWKIFMDKLQKEGKKDAVLVMHTDPLDQEGPNLIATVEALGLTESVIFSNQRVSFEHINVLHNMSDVCLNISFAEGFGLATLESMQVGTPIIAGKTGGLTRQVVDHRDGSENGVALPIKTKTLVGSQHVPYIYEDYVDNDDVARGLYKLYNMSPQEKEELSLKVEKYANEEFAYEKTVDEWHNTLKDTVENWRNRYKRYEVIKL
jgi:glycosyltransferase involved in cell wall biosynthesis